MSALLALLAHGELVEQIRMMDRRIEEAPAHARHRLRRGELWRLHGETHLADAALAAEAWTRAEEDFAKALELDPGLREVQLARARARLAAARPAEALRALDDFLPGAPEHALARLYEARALAALGRREDAVAAYDRSILRDPAPTPDAYLERAALQEALGRREDAVRGLDEGLARLGPLAVLDLRALALEAPLGAHAASLARVERWLARPGRKEAWLLRRAEILARLGRGADARSSAGEALAALRSLPASRRDAEAVREMERRARALLER